MQLESRVSVASYPFPPGGLDLWADAAERSRNRDRGEGHAVVVEAGERIVYANSAFAAALGYSDPDELIGEPVGRFIAGADRIRMKEYGRRRAAGLSAPIHYSFTALTRDGRGVHVVAHITTEQRSGQFFITTRIEPAASIPTVEDFSDLYVRTAGAVLSLLIEVLGDRSEAQEVLRETFVQAWQERNRAIEHRGSNQAWLISIARGRALERLRRRGSPDRETDATPGISGLPLDQQEVVRLAYFRGMTIDQISARLGVPAGTVKARLLSAMNTLRKHSRAASDA